jgi:malate dehydrogenase (oxaloacetate-decarboxylating)
MTSSVLPPATPSHDVVHASTSALTPDSEGRYSAAFSNTLRLSIENKPGKFAEVCRIIAELDASLAEVTLLSSDFDTTLRDVTVSFRSELHSQKVRDALSALPCVTLVAWQDDTFAMHQGGKLRVHPTEFLRNTDELARAYSPGVARVCMAIHKDPSLAYDYTIKRNTVAVITDGSAVLGLGNIGPEAAMPVMEGKAVLFKQFGGIDAYPICLTTQNVDEIIHTVKLLAPGLGGINLEDISAPRCFEIEQRLQEELDIPVFHDDQHGTAVVVLAGLLNAMKITGKKLSDLKVVMNGFGAGGVACTKILLDAGVKNIIPCDTVGAVYRGRQENMNRVKEEVVALTNPENVRGTVADALIGADVFIGVSQPKAITRAMVQTMASHPIIFALANPTPEILPHEVSDIARIVATGRSDYANQINNVLCFPGIFRGALDARAKKISSKMKVAAAYAIAESVPDNEIRETKIVPGVFEKGIAERVARRVYEAAVEEGLARPARAASSNLLGRHDASHWQE